MLDVLIVTVIYVKRLKKKGLSNEEIKPKVLPCAIIAAAFSLVMFFWLLFPFFGYQLRTIYKNDSYLLYDVEFKVMATLMRTTPLFYPVWGSYFYGLTYLRDKGGFKESNRIEKSYKICKNDKKCLYYFNDITAYNRKELFLQEYEKLFLSQNNENRCLSFFPYKRGMFEYLDNRKVAYRKIIKMYKNNVIKDCELFYRSVISTSFELQNTKLITEVADKYIEFKGVKNSILLLHMTISRTSKNYSRELGLNFVNYISKKSLEICQPPSSNILGGSFAKYCKELLAKNL